MSVLAGACGLQELLLNDRPPALGRGELPIYYLTST